jgi:N-methylhydantoinase A/oxoprolinase/acetone carboxylase beta subunit
MMKSNGGVVEAHGGRPAGQPPGPARRRSLGAAHFAALVGLNQVMTIDIGGTS